MKDFIILLGFICISFLSSSQEQTIDSMNSLYKNKEGKSAILNLYQEKLNSLDIEFEEIDVSTSYGKIHIITSGESSKPPMILVHGSNGCAPIALETYNSLIGQFRVYAIDVLAQPNKSAETRLSMKDESYGVWMNEVISKLKLDSVSMAGFSLGGLVILKTLEHDESKIKEVFLTAPAYIVNGNPLSALFKVFIPMKRYMKTEKSQYVEKFLSAIFSQKDEFAIKYLSKVFLEFDMDFTPVPTINSSKAKGIKTPITLFAADNDILFPGRKMLRRASKIFPSLAHSELLINSKHVQTTEDNVLICQKIMSK